MGQEGKGRKRKKKGADLNFREARKKEDKEEKKRGKRGVKINQENTKQNK